jgi:hypothetical protein
MGSRKRAPGIDGISLEFYFANWELIGPDLLDLFNHMFLTNTITAKKNQWIIVCIKKEGKYETPDGYRPITLLTNEYKILARILAGRLKQIVQDNITSNQYCGVPERLILEAVATVRDTIAYAESYNVTMCVLTLDFQQAFDRVSHQYLFQVLRQYGINEWFIARVQALYDNATDSVQVNGSLKGNINIQSAVRQGCPMSMVLYTLGLQPFLRSLERKLPGLALGAELKGETVIAYADDVTVFVTNPNNFDVIRNEIMRYEQASGPRLNPNKSHGIAIGTWSYPAAPLGLDYKEQIKILGITFGTTTRKSALVSWNYTIQKIRAQARCEYGRTLCLAQRIQYVQLCLLAKAWYLAQVFPQHGHKCSNSQRSVRCSYGKVPFSEFQ